MCDRLDCCAVYIQLPMRASRMGDAASAKQKQTAHLKPDEPGCPGEDSNLHPLRDTALNRARLPFRHQGIT